MASRKDGAAPKGGANVLSVAESGHLQGLLTEAQNPDASIAELRALYANLQEHTERYAGSMHTSPSSVPADASPRGAQDDNSVGESLEETADDKKKKLSKQQVAELETMFQGGYTGAPEGRGPISKQMGISERQVAIWFQNRRARQRSKELSQDFEMLKKDFRMVFLENQILRRELSELRAQVNTSAERDASSVFPPTNLSVNPGYHSLTPVDSGFQLNPSNHSTPIQHRNPQNAVDLGQLLSHGQGPLDHEHLLQHAESLPLQKRPRLFQSEAGPFATTNPSVGILDGSGLNTASFGGRPQSGLLESVVATANVLPAESGFLQSGGQQWRVDELAASRGLGQGGLSDGLDQSEDAPQIRAELLRHEAYRSFLEASGNAELLFGDSQNDSQKSNVGSNKRT